MQLVIDITTNRARPFDEDGSTVLASYKYLGAGRIVSEDYEDVAVKLDYNADDNLGGFDRFGRVVDQLCTDYGANPAVDARKRIISDVPFCSTKSIRLTIRRPWNPWSVRS